MPIARSSTQQLQRAHGSQQDEVRAAWTAARSSWRACARSSSSTLLLANTLEGFFADPIYGGNRDKAGWKTGRLPRRRGRLHDAC